MLWRGTPEIFVTLRGGWMDRWTDGRMDGWSDGRMDGWTDGRMDGWTDGRMKRWMDGQMDRWTDGAILVGASWLRRILNPAIAPTLTLVTFSPYGAQFTSKTYLSKSRLRCSTSCELDLNCSLYHASKTVTSFLVAQLTPKVLVCLLNKQSIPKSLRAEINCWFSHCNRSVKLRRPCFYHLKANKFTKKMLLSTKRCTWQNYGIAVTEKTILFQKRRQL
jgi:hypothetical protein